MTAVLTFADGRQLVLSESTVPDGSGAARTRTALPLTLSQLTAVAGSTTWKPLLASLPDAPSRPAPSIVQTLPASRITRIISGSLPGELRVADESGQPGFGHLTVDDGHGKCLIAVTVQRWKPDDPAIGKVFGDARRLPDGTRVMTSKAPATRGGAGAVEWQADTLAKDGLRVLVSEVNARAYRLRGARSTPVLSIDQLIRIALNSAWSEASDYVSRRP
ncbi:hypothetical protein ACIQZB_40405 [Streptomyces sp. NPDC097727]|uniref:hypothetical protein n=1 Tax=Streptomyces sp. NPDC097727 TaxID=3366092 RepID=UPI0038126702